MRDNDGNATGSASLLYKCIDEFSCSLQPMFLFLPYSGRHSLGSDYDLLISYYISF
jgi:hypothetical protein